MKKFELPSGTYILISKATPRKEHHGDDLVQAISLRLSWTTTNDSLEKLHPNLKAMLFWKTPSEEAQERLEGVPEITPNLRVPTVATPLAISAEYAGYQLTIDHGIDESSALQLYQCEMDKFKVDPKEGGSVTISWSLSSNKSVTPELVGALCGLEGEEVTVELVAPEMVQPDDVIDGDRMRMLSADECRAAMGFPSGYRLPSTHKEAVHLLGNAVCPPVACDLITAIKEAA